MFKRLAVPVAATMIAAGIAVPQAVASEKCSIEVVSGTLNWGIKQSWRSYVQGPIAKGKWETAGSVSEGSGGKSSAGFAFTFEVDPQTSKVVLDSRGKVSSAEIKTKMSSLTFTGHGDSLRSVMKSPYVSVNGQDVKAGASYEGYYVEGKEMTKYEAADRTDANKKTGTDTFASGQLEGWKLNSENLSFAGKNMRYTPKPLTDGKKNIIDGIDILFMGIYNDEYKPEVDDVNIELTVKNNCGLKNGRVPEAEKPQSPKDLSLGNFPKIWSIVLGVAGLVATVAVLFQVAMKSGVLRNLPFMNV
ncbi:HtaA domain-containing protein [Corynebacterium silvaticum]|uniref:HtaA domain-containing protein n=1 Tax=Corynebacterium silvaticum TaxID=2320431 RepID=A0A7Y4LK09_9CORY|nr:HtaA domain-containing protein [Corynebacterium silvaticum]ARU45602.1 HtaA domain-containing protein [Corynebacterium silvaticum]MBH5300186.1 HtaA domain-containing protein [Corynebacterium silvaticum]NOM65602.1 HtaA domain-containing protein [Corynebacterium silvaticum]NON70448.1 HtaA domain-containing protein [Corynebacterium silvaticum]TFA92033.1 hemin receptor [Corynebacterium silvaticum]